MDKANLDQVREFVRDYPFPTNILIETHAYCNLRCIMCPYSKLTRTKGKMSYALWKKLVDEVARKSPETIIWPALMGEPLLMSDELFEWIAYAKQKGIQTICLNTNLTKFEPGMLDGLFDCGVDKIFVGLDSATAETYSQIRVRGDYEKVKGNVELILKEKQKRGLDKPHVNLQFIVMDENEGEEQKFVDTWKGFGHGLSLKIRRRTSWGGAVTPWSGVTEANTEDRIPCTWLLREMVVFWNGDVPKCDSDWDGKYIVGNANENSLEELWNGPLKLKRDKHLRYEFTDPLCEACDDWRVGLSVSMHCDNE